MRSILKRIARRVLRRQPAGQPAVPPLTQTDPTFPARKARKLARLAELLRTDLPHRLSERGYDFLTDELRQQFNITDTDNVSSNQYDPTALAMIETYRDGWILDCGAGSRRVYYDNVVNFEICDYDSTDVRGVGERLPFRDGVFDAAFSFAVLEHVKDPFACAREIARTLKPGGVLYCVVPFLQPLHGYPNHYFNMSHQGLRTLFEPSLIIEKQEVIPSGHPIWTLAWIIARWGQALPPRVRRRFLSMRLGELLADPVEQLQRDYAAALPVAAQFELASTTALFARKAAA